MLQLQKSTAKSVINQPIHPKEQSQPNIENNSLPTEVVFETQSNNLCQQKRGNYKIVPKIKYTKLFHKKINNVYQLDGYVK